MVQQAKTSVKILEGTALLVRIPNSPTYHVKYKVGGKWLRTSTKQSNLTAAKAAAAEIVVEARVRAKAGIPTVNQSFRAVCKAAIARMDRELAAGQGKVTYETYKLVLNRYHLPFFSSTHISKIDYALLSRFDEWRIAEAGKQLSKSAITNHNSALNRVFDEAVLLGYMTRAQVPELRNNGLDGEARPAFDLNDYRKLHRALRHYCSAPASKKRSVELRLLLRDYVLLSCNIGWRPGTETEALRWKHITLTRENNGDETLELYIPRAKTKARFPIARVRCKDWFERIYKRAEDLQHYESFEAMLDARLDIPVFRLGNGDVISNRVLGEQFEKFLTKYNLLTCSRTGQPFTLYSCRHTYATFALQAGIEIYPLAKQMGTSVALIEKHYSKFKPWDARKQLRGM